MTTTTPETMARAYGREDHSARNSDKDTGGVFSTLVRHGNVIPARHLYRSEQKKRSYIDNHQQPTQSHHTITFTSLHTTHYCDIMISDAKRRAGKRSYKNLKLWNDAVTKARKDLSLIGFVPLHKDTEFYIVARRNYDEMKKKKKKATKV